MYVYVYVWCLERVTGGEIRGWGWIRSRPPFTALDYRRSPFHHVPSLTITLILHRLPLKKNRCVHGYNGSHGPPVNLCPS